MVFVFGLIVGSFLNVCISRWPDEKSVISPRSRCPKCENLILWYDNIPLLSWLYLKAKCRHCALRISWIYPGVELLTGLCFLAMWKALFFVLAQSPQALSNASLIAILFTGIFLMAISIVVFFVDCKHFEIPDEISLNLMPLGPLLCMFFPAVMAQTLYTKIHDFNGPLMQSTLRSESWLEALMMSLAGVVVGGGVLWLLAVFGEKLLRKEAMGFGDVKLLAMLGGFLGVEGVLMTLMGACFLGATYGIISLIVTRKNILPFGPWLVISALLIFVFKYEVLKKSLEILHEMRQWIFSSAPV
jgi:leader peptidase (prepilin peptidase)/N-methyltransferase